jgi:hypothetical protein
MFPGSRYPLSYASLTPARPSLPLLPPSQFFLFFLDLMGGSFKVLGGCTAGAMFEGLR